jgi:hypothetical protein
MSSLYTRGEAQRRAEIELTVGDARKAITEALGYIERQEDGPLTMRHALKDIGNTINSLEHELFELHYTIETLNRLAARSTRRGHVAAGHPNGTRCWQRGGRCEGERGAVSHPKRAYRTARRHGALPEWLPSGSPARKFVLDSC